LKILLRLKLSRLERLIVDEAAILLFCAAPFPVIEKKISCQLSPLASSSVYVMREL
jgi:hypothetical protein